MRVRRRLAATPRITECEGGVAYKWIALSNTTLGTIMAFMNQTVLLISLPAIFAGLDVDPLAPGQTSLPLWVLMGYKIASTVLLVAFGRISDTYGKVRFYNLGLAASATSRRKSTRR